MESPTSIVKSAINPSSVIKAVIGVFIAAAIFDALGWTGYLLYPVSALKAKFAAKTTAS